MPSSPPRTSLITLTRVVVTTALLLNTTTTTWAYNLQQDPLANLQPLADNATLPHPAAMTSIATNTSVTTNQPWSSPGYPQLILFGDSITQGARLTLQPHLTDLYIRRLDIINRGFSGYNTEHAVPLLPLLYPRPSPRVALLTVFFGANDACLPGNAQHVPLATYKAHLRTIATYPPAHLHGTKLIFLTPPPFDEWQQDPKQQPPQRTAAHTKLYADACAQVASEENVPLVDVWTTFMTRAGWKPEGVSSKGTQDLEGEQGTKAPLVGSRDAPRSETLARLLSDGLHLTDEGYAIVGEELMRVIAERVPEMAPERVPMVVPEWTEVMGVAV